jgi:hypothetical protein
VPHAPDIADELAEPLRLEREAVIGSFPRTIERYMFLEYARPLQISDRTGQRAVEMIGRPYGTARKFLHQDLDILQAEPVVLAGVLGHTVQHRDFIVVIDQDIDAGTDLIDLAAADADHHGLALLCDAVNERQIAEIERGHLDQIDADLADQVETRLIEGRRHELDAVFDAILFQ